MHWAHDDISDLKKVIEYDRKYNNISVLSMSLYKDWDQTYSERMKNSTPIKNTIDRNGTTNENEYEDEVNLIGKKKKPWKLKYNIKIRTAMDLELLLLLRGRGK